MPRREYSVENGERDRFRAHFDAAMQGCIVKYGWGSVDLVIKKAIEFADAAMDALEPKEQEKWESGPKNTQ